MSDARPRRQDEGPPPPPRAPSRRSGPVIAGSIAAVLVVVVAVLVVVGVWTGGQLSGSDQPTAPSLTASPFPTATAAPGPSPTTSTAAPPSADATPPPPGRTVSPDVASPPASPGPPGPPEPTNAPEAAREPTDVDAAAFAADFVPGGPQAEAEQVRSVAADTDGDGRDEIVVASLVGGFAQVDIARWDGRAYRLVFTAQGGSGEVLEDLRVTDYTGDGWREVVTSQSTGGGGQSLSVYGWDGQAHAPQAAQGGCWHGSATYGVLGARIEPGEITATCDDPDLPLAAQPSDVYRWDGHSWVFSHREGGQ